MNKKNRKLLKIFALIVITTELSRLTTFYRGYFAIGGEFLLFPCIYIAKYVKSQIGEVLWAVTGWKK